MVDVSLYLVTDRTLLPANRSLNEAVKEAILGGATIVQLREKTLNSREFLAQAKELRQLCSDHSVPFVVNDRIDIALASDADGVHIGQDDVPLVDARRLLGPNKIIGVTVKTVQQALDAVAGGADYIAPGVVFPTNTKDNAVYLGPSGVGKVVAAVRAVHATIPIVTIGGINDANVSQMLEDVEQASGGHKLTGVAVVSAIIKHVDAKEAAAKLRANIEGRVQIIPKVSLSRTPNMDVIERVIASIHRVRTNKPFVHSITNNVVHEMTANIILHMGGSPIMAHSIDEVEEIGDHINSLIINMGTLDTNRIAAFHAAASRANTRGTPILLDPVGCGFTHLRRTAVASLLSSHRVALIKGNAGEMAHLAQEGGASSRGADSVGALAHPAAVARAVAKRYGATVCITGAVDYVSDGARVIRCENGNASLGLLTGTGCSTTALMGCFAGVVEGGDYLTAAVAGCVVMGVAAERAVEMKIGGGLEGQKVVLGPASFRMALFDSIYLMDADTVRKYAKVFEVTDEE